MEIKRPFSEADWLATPKPVRDYVLYLEQIIMKQAEHIQRLQEVQRQLEKRLDELEDRLNRNSRNSNKPPSTDPPFSKPAMGSGSGKKKKKRKKGGQKGHQGHRQELLEASRVVDLKPEACPCGNHHLPDHRMEPFYTHQVIELPKIQMEVTHFVLHRANCPECGRTVKAALPKSSRSGYGPRLSALIAEMSGTMGAGRETVKNFCRSVLGIHISIGAVQNVIDRAAAAIEPIYDEIGRLARRAPVNHVDETSFFQEVRLQWLWTMTNHKTAFFMIHAHRSKEAFLDLIQNWRGTLVSDDYGVYRKWADKRQSCLAHLIRRAKGLSEKKDEKIAAFGQSVLAELRLLCHWAKAPPNLDEELAFYNRFVHLLLDHHKHRDETGKFSRRMLKELESLWLFMEENGVEPTNNRAERALRFAVLWRKRSNGTQSNKGDRWVERILTLKETCRLHASSTYQILTEAIDSFFKEQEPNLTWITTD
jgi:transposase